MGAIIISLLEALLYCAVVIFIAFIFVWLLQYIFGITIDGNVLKWGKIIVALICAIVLLGWLFSVIGIGGVTFPRLTYHGY